ncbi:uncharacterized protein [Rutidosis leptorrhynchoides]|uniref:uncharacterized protein n=1 Tax=Rutidosis leptorrhynchoides TaxID=125765 RepID=UPI003A9985C3
MGACLSSTGDSIHKFTCALVISNKGELRLYPTPIFVSEVLHLENPSSFICNSDNLFYDENVISLNLEDELDAGQIYFILPKTMLSRRLSVSDMAALAVKANKILLLTLAPAAPAPAIFPENGNTRYKQQRNNGNGGLRVSRSRSIRKIMRGRLAAIRLFRLRLSTIYEKEGCDDVMQFVTIDKFI